MMNDTPTRERRVRRSGEGNRPRATGRIIGATLAALGLVAAGCSSGGGNADGPGDCVAVYTAVSSEKIRLMSDLASEFNDSDAEMADGTCIYVEVQSKASGLGATLLAEGWDELADGPRPVVWSPASSAWGSVVNQRRADAGLPPVVGDGVPFMVTPLVIAMPEPMAAALGWPDEPIGWSDILALSTGDQGWAAFGHPEWGDFRLGKTNPNFSTSGLSALIAQTYAAAGKTENLNTEDLARPAVVDFGRGVESAVVHYGDTTLTFMNNWYKADQRGAALGYVAAAAVEEKSVIDYNSGNPDGRLDPGEEPRPPKVQLVAIYPEEGTLYSDNPLFVVDDEWVDDAQREGRPAFIDFVQLEENQRKVLEFGFRPGNPRVALAAPISAEFGVDPDQPSDLLEVPEPEVMTGAARPVAHAAQGCSRHAAARRVRIDGRRRRRWADQTGAGHLGDPVRPRRLLAERRGLAGHVHHRRHRHPDHHQPRSFPTGRSTTNRAAIERSLGSIFPQSGTPLFEAIDTVYAEAVAGYDPELINAIVVLSDGANSDENPSDDQQQFDRLLANLSRGSEGQGSKPVRVFPIAYGAGASLDVLGAIAESASSAVYDASDPRSIDKVFAEVISNF